jgi:hypothetical protein
MTVLLDSMATRPMPTARSIDDILTPRFLELLDRSRQPSAHPSARDGNSARLRGQLHCAQYMLAQSEASNENLQLQVSAASASQACGRVGQDSLLEQVQALDGRLQSARRTAEELARTLCGAPAQSGASSDDSARHGESGAARLLLATLLHQLGSPAALQLGELKGAPSLGRLHEEPPPAAPAEEAERLRRALREAEEAHERRCAELLKEVLAAHEREGLHAALSGLRLKLEDCVAQDVVGEHEAQLDALLTRCAQASHDWHAAEQASKASGRKRRSASKHAAEKLARAAALGVSEAGALKQHRLELRQLAIVLRDLLGAQEQERVARIKLQMMLSREHMAEVGTLRRVIEQQHVLLEVTNQQVAQHAPAEVAAAVREQAASLLREAVAAERRGAAAVPEEARTTPAAIVGAALSSLRSTLSEGATGDVTQRLQRALLDPAGRLVSAVHASLAHAAGTSE